MWVIIDLLDPDPDRIPDLDPLTWINLERKHWVRVIKENAYPLHPAYRGRD